MKNKIPEWLLICQFPNALVYLDKSISDKKTDYKEIAKVYFKPLELKIIDNSRGYKPAIELAKKEFEKRSGKFDNLNVKKKTLSADFTPIFKYKDVIAVRDEYSATQGNVHFYKNGNKCATYSLEYRAKENEPLRWFQNDGEVKRSIDHFLMNNANKK